MGPNIHRAEQYRSAIPGIEACALISNQSFPRHAHDQFGIGVIAAGTQRSWSGIEPVEVQAGDVITVIAGEMHNGNRVRGRVRRWRMLVADAGLLSWSAMEEVPSGIELARARLAGPASRRPPRAALLHKHRPDAMTSSRGGMGGPGSTQQVAPERVIQR